MSSGVDDTNFRSCRSESDVTISVTRHDAALEAYPIRQPMQSRFSKAIFGGLHAAPDKTWTESMNLRSVIGESFERLVSCRARPQYASQALNHCHKYKNSHAMTIAMVPIC